MKNKSSLSYLRTPGMGINWSGASPVSEGHRRVIGIIDDNDSQKAAL